VTGAARRNRLLLGLAAVFALATLVLALAGGRSAHGSSEYRVDAIFDTAKGIIPGQVVKVAGARVGTIKDVVLTPDFKARIEMKVDSEFAPFRTDASCTIQPEGLISENFVQCDPGSPSGQPLRAQGGNAPTVPVSRTSVPVSINDLFNIWRVPVRQRLSVVLAALGASVAGHGEDLNTLLRRANPTLGLVRKVTGILNDQKNTISQLVSDTDTVVAQLGKRSGRVASFIDNASRVTSQTGSHQEELAAAVRRLPALLDAARPALEHLDTLAANGTPVLGDLHKSAPSLNNVLTHLRPFSVAAAPALKDLGKLGVQGARTAKSGAPLVGKLRGLADTAKPAASTADSLFQNVRDRGVIEGLMSFFYYLAASTARYDSVSHMLPAHILLNSCGMLATAPVAGCNATYGPDQGTRKSTQKTSSGDKAPAAHKPLLPSLPVPAPSQGRKPLLPKLPKLPVPGLNSLLQPILDLLPGQKADPSDKTVKSLLDYLLK